MRTWIVLGLVGACLQGCAGEELICSEGRGACGALGVVDGQGAGGGDTSAAGEADLSGADAASGGDTVGAAREQDAPPADGGPADGSEAPRRAADSTSEVAGGDDASNAGGPDDAVGGSVVITVDEGTAVTPQTILHLHAPEQLAGGAVTKVEWAVEQPEGSVSLLVPSTSHPDPTLEANVAGTYIVALTVWDDLGKRHLAAPLTIVATPDSAVHIELLWDTPGDTDQSDEGPEAGADLDLHFTHPEASGPDLDGDGIAEPWFDQPYDCFWFNAHPIWGSFDPSVGDDPSLDRDDTDGAGPENLNLDEPEDGATYRIGVHAWSDHKLGPSFATLRVYVYGELVWERAGIELENHELWDAATLSWPSGAVTPVVGPDGGDKVSADQTWACFMPCW